MPSNPFRQNELSRLLPDLNRILIAHHDIRETFPRICRRLQPVLNHQSAAISLYEKEASCFRLYAQHTSSGVPLPKDLAYESSRTPCGKSFRSRKPLLVDDLRDPRFKCATTQALLKLGRRSGCWAPLQTADSVLGTLHICSGRPAAYRVEDAYLLSEVASQISLALANQLGLQQLQALRQQLDEQIHDWNRSFRDIAATAVCGVSQWGAGGVISDANDIFLGLIGRTRDDLARGLNVLDIAPGAEYLDRRLRAEEELRDHGSFTPFEGGYVLPDGSRRTALIAPGLLNQRRPPWLALVLELGAERGPIEGSPGIPVVLPSSKNEMLAANSPTMRQIVREIEQVAPTETSVLLLGEAGTGKELLAHEVHRLSPRRLRPFVKVNCAAIPAELLERELFGYEKGAFPGADCRKTGSIELARGGTLFLDEVSHLPVAFQPTLLSVLQELKFERLGGREPVKVDVRLITSTSRNLAEMVLAGQFRRDLFYRLSVFPVRVPPLRERPESIPALVHHFVAQFTRRLNRPPLAIPARIMAMLERWQWPDNIQELENLIERCVLLSPGPDLQVDLGLLHVKPPPTGRTRGNTSFASSRTPTAW